MTESTAAAAADRLTVLRNSHDRLADLVGAMSDADVEGPSYNDDWTMAQTLSHIGSGAEIFSGVVAAVAAGDEPPGPEKFQPIWDEWNAKSPQDQARDAITADRTFLETVEALSDAERSAWRADLFGSERGLDDLLGMRLNEHALHTWDIAVINEPDAEVAADAVELIVDGLAMIVQYTAKPPVEPVTVAFTTTAPARTITLAATADGVSLTDDSADAAGTVNLPAEALVRLFYGRLDDAHAPDVDASGITLDELRAIFPGP